MKRLLKLIAKVKYYDAIGKAVDLNNEQFMFDADFVAGAARRGVYLSRCAGYKLWEGGYGAEYIADRLSSAVCDEIGRIHKDANFEEVE